MAYSALAQSATPISPTVQPAASYIASPAIGLVHTQPIYSNPYR